MTDFVLDASVTMSWCFEDEADHLSTQVLFSLKKSLALVPALWFLEVSNILLVGERKKRIKPEDSLRFTALIKALPIQIDEGFLSFTDLLQWGRSYNLSAYDAAYLILAMRNDLPLATRDKQLIKAAQNAGVPLYTPDS